MYTFHGFKVLPKELQIEASSYQGIPLDLAYNVKSAEAILFANLDFYVELIVERFTDEIIAREVFKSTKKLEPYLHRVDISESNPPLTCGS